MPNNKTWISNVDVKLTSTLICQSINQITCKTTLCIRSTSAR